MAVVYAGASVPIAADYRPVANALARDGRFARRGSSNWPAIGYAHLRLPNAFRPIRAGRPQAVVIVLTHPRPALCSRARTHQAGPLTRLTESTA